MLKKLKIRHLLIRLIKASILFDSFKRAQYFFLLRMTRNIVIERKKISRKSIAWPIEEKLKNESNIPKIIWSYWHGEPSSCVAACRSSWFFCNSDYNINILDDSNLKKYLPNFPEINSSAPIQNKSDLVRLMLLEKYGGYWLDSSILLTSSLDWVGDLLNKSYHSVFAFYNEFPGEYASDHDKPTIENGFLAAKKNSLFIKHWRKLYQKCITNENYKYFFRNFKNYDELKRNFISQNERQLDYFVCFIAAQQILRTKLKSEIILFNAEDEYLFDFYNTTPPRNTKEFSKKSLLLPAPINPARLIKITGGHRKTIDEYIQYNCYRQNSLIGFYVKK